MSEKFNQLKIMQEMFPNATFVDANGERVADTSKTIIVEKEVYEAVLRNSLRVCDLEKENEDLISRKNWCNARAKKILEKNKQLKQLLKECRDVVDENLEFSKSIGRNRISPRNEGLLKRIDEVLK